MDDDMRSIASVAMKYNVIGNMDKNVPLGMKI